MSLKAVSWAIEQDLPPTQKVIMIALAMFMNDGTGLCCPPRKKLAALVNISEATLKRQLAQLEASGMIVRRARFSKKTQLQTSNIYIINFRKGRRLKMSPFPQYDDDYFEVAQNEPANNPAGSPAEPPAGSPAEPPIDSFKGNRKEEGASGASASRDSIRDEEELRRDRIAQYRQRPIWPLGWGARPTKQELIDFERAEKEKANGRNDQRTGKSNFGATYAAKRRQGSDDRRLPPHAPGKSHH